MWTQFAVILGYVLSKKVKDSAFDSKLHESGFVLHLHNLTFPDEQSPSTEWSGHLFFSIIMVFRVKVPQRWVAYIERELFCV